MELKLRLQRVLQIVEEAERVGALSDIERDMVLAELREAYADVKFGTCVGEKEVVVSVAPVAPETPPTEVEEEEDEPEMEVEIIFNEDDESETENEEQPSENEIAEPAVAEVAEPIIEDEPVVAEPIVEDEPVVAEPIVETPPTPAPQPTPAPKRSPILSLYEDEPTPVVGEQFHEAPSVADTIARPKGVADMTPVKSLRESIGVADGFMLIEELFDGNVDAFNSAIDTLDAQTSFDDCLIFISENYSWRANSEGAKLIMDLLQRKHNA
ncbi:MAG: hypothetical protein IKV09_05210 [Alistipes sp.]|nr:hypothetical protein [Alistipes sp.]